MARILIIDDDDNFRGMLKKTLERSGHSVTEARNGSNGIEQCRKEAVSMVVTDIVMPEKEGLETIRELRREFPDTKVVAVSGHTDQFFPADPLRIAELLGAQLTFEKPFDRSRFLQQVEALL